MRAAGNNSALVRRARKAKAELPYWKRKTLSEMSQIEWEALCDGCGKCCLNKLEYEDTGVIEQTNVACKLLDTHSCRCRDYPNRKKHVPDCIQLTPRKIKSMDWLPPTCGYRLAAAGKDLYWWHPLVSGDPETVHRAGISARGRVISETEAGPLEDHIVNWDD
jgi:uncharacterized cysteine cluster protein YcgN (CxxCxxCC family)